MNSIYFFIFFIFFCSDVLCSTDNIIEFFLVFSVLSSSLSLVRQKNPFIALLLLVYISVIYIIVLIMLNSILLAFTIGVLYIGAVVVLFIFVTMLMDQAFVQHSNDKRDTLFYYSSLFGVLIMFVPYYRIWLNTIYLAPYQSGFFNEEFIDYIRVYNDPAQIQKVFFIIYENYFVSLIVIAFCLLIALVGSMVLTVSYRYPYKFRSKSQTIFEQVEADYNKSIRLRK